MNDDSLSSDDAAAFLGVTKATLYSYASRGMLSSLPVAPGSRERAYRKADLVALKHRSSFRKDPERAASEVIEFGVPILTTSISQITESEHSYRGRSSRELSQRFSFEQVAQFLWTGAHDGDELPPPRPEWQLPIDTTLTDGLSDALTPMEKMQCMLPLLERQNLHAYGTKAAVLVPSAIQLLLYLNYLSSGLPYRGSISETLQDAWGVDARRLDTLLTVVADHELNIATFTARCAASAGATLYQSVMAGLSALQGYKHLYGQVSAAQRFFREVLADGDPEAVVRSYLRRGGTIPGIHNPYRRLYAGPDPRVQTLFENLAGSPHYELLLETVRLIDDATSEHPRIDFALAVSGPVLDLPEDSIFSLIAVGRTAGMVAHVLEQYASERVIRPRARFVPAVEAN